MICNGFNIAAEEVNLIFIIAMLYITVVSHPRRTAVFSVVFHGQLLALATTVFHILSIVLVDFDTTLQGVFFRITVMLYYVCYMGVLILLFTYIHLLSMKQRENLDILNMSLIAFSAIYLLVVGSIYYKEKYITIVNNKITLTPYFNVNIAFAVIASMFVIGSVVFNRNGIPKIFMKYLMIFTPAEVFLIILQLFRPRYIFLSVTYSLPFLLCYTLFHSILFDEVTGCQNKMAFASHFHQFKRQEKSFAIMYLKFPRLEIVDNMELMGIVKKRISKEIRSLENKNKKAHVYQINDYTFAVIFERSSHSLTRQTITFVKKRLDETMMSWEFSNRPEYQMVFIEQAERISDMQYLDAFSGLLFENCVANKTNYYESTLEDLAICTERRKIEKVIVDIRNNDDLNDPRIIVFVQPIIDVSTGKFRSAEALMRLEVDGEIVRPDIFIPLAEKVGCVHTLTRIILNKVCRKIYEIQDYYNFEAVSVNVSLSEFMDYDLHDELIEIITKNGVSPEKIRLEMTETMTSDEYEAIAHNMEEFNVAGVHFYLDDFGTGYSNLERIVSLPFKTIKFDKTLLYKSEDDPILMQLIQNMVEVFKKHGLIALVEGVENEQQETLSIRLGFEYIQGYKFAKPVPVNQVEDFFEKKQKRMA